jgi:hypothetical protein
VLSPTVENIRAERLSGVTVEALALHTGAGIVVPLLLLRPEGAGAGPLPVVVGLAEGGKDRFLKDRSREVARLLSQGIAVCLPDVRGTGETASEQYNRGEEPASKVLASGNTLLGLRLADLRTVIGYLSGRADLDRERIALWGESFAPENSPGLRLDELTVWPVGPQIQHLASSLGAHLALLGALYENRIRAVAARGGLVSQLSILERNFTYVPFDMFVPGVFNAGDIADICVALAPRPVLVGGAVDGRDCAVGADRLAREMTAATGAYVKAGAAQNLALGTGPAQTEPVSWLIGKLK